MHEIIHVSLSAQANHLSTHFYNAQSSYFVFDDSLIDSTSYVDPNVLFRAGVGTDNKTKTFTPRSIIWDMRGGFGALKKSNPLYDYNSHASSSEINIWSEDGLSDSQHNSLLKEDQVPVSSYQKALDSGKSSSNILNTSNTKYWSDYLNIYFNPRLSFHTIPNWQYDPVKAPLGYPRGTDPDKNSRKFISFDTGVEEYRSANALGDDSAYIEDTLRPLIEECDSVSGFTFFTELDTAWGAFTAKVIEEFREDYVPKTPIFVYADCDDNLTADKYSFDYKGRLINKVGSFSATENNMQTKQQAISRIKTLTALASSSSLLIPISKPKDAPEKLKLYDCNSLWHTAALQSLPVETLSLLSSLRGNARVSMQSILDSLQNGSNRNIVSSIEGSIIRPSNTVDDAAQSKKLKDVSLQSDFNFTGSLFSGLSGDKEKFFSKVATLRRDYGEKIESSTANSQTNKAILEYQKLMMAGNKSNAGPQSLDSTAKTATELFDSLFNQRELLNEGTSEIALKRLSCPQPLATPGSFPLSALEINDYSQSMYLPKNKRDELPRPDAIYASMGITSKPRLYLRNFEKTISKFTRNTDDGVEELKDDTAALAEEYQWGWEEEDDFFDD